MPSAPPEDGPGTSEEEAYTEPRLTDALGQVVDASVTVTTPDEQDDPDSSQQDRPSNG